MILSERNHEAGAYFVDFEKFKAVYRFSERLKENTQQANNLLEVTLDTNDDEAREEFLNVLIKNLQRSDCVTQCGRDQFLILLNDAHDEKIKAIKNRILTTWQNKNFSGEITFETTV
ncbi:MAG: hypothetical protein IKG61_07465 [Selenomonadaceae bacterium]|nr:hypothetical protein [Selenomonadaceae bacterium]